MFKWIRCKDRLPRTPANPLEVKEYLIVSKESSGYLYNMAYWADGWNCTIDFSGHIDRENEMKNVVAWAEVPEYKYK